MENVEIQVSTSRGWSENIAIPILRNSVIPYDHLRQVQPCIPAELNQNYITEWRDTVFNCHTQVFPILFQSTFFPFHILGQLYERLRIVRAALFTFSFILLIFGFIVLSSFLSFGYYCYILLGLIFVSSVAFVRYRMRVFHRIAGNVKHDICLSTFCYPCVISQMARHYSHFYESFDSLCLDLNPEGKKSICGEWNPMPTVAMLSPDPRTSHSSNILPHGNVRNIRVQPSPVPAITLESRTGDELTPVDHHEPPVYVVHNTDHLPPSAWIQASPITAIRAYTMQLSSRFISSSFSNRDSAIAVPDIHHRDTADLSGHNQRNGLTASFHDEEKGDDNSSAIVVEGFLASELVPFSPTETNGVSVVQLV